MALIEADGARIAYDEYGEGTNGANVVFLHGFPLNRLLWEPQMDDLRGVAHLVAPDMRGHGSSDVSEGTLTMERMADDVHALVTSLGLEPVVLVGLSMGGYVALAYVRKYADSLRALVLADTRATAETDEGRAARYEMIEEVAENGPSTVAEKMLPRLLSRQTRDENPELVAAVRRMCETTSAAGIVGALAGMAERPDATELLGTIAVPTLVVVGGEDEVTPPDEASRMAAAIPGARFETIEGAGHLSNYEKPDLFNAILKEFLAGLPEVGSRAEA